MLEHVGKRRFGHDASEAPAALVHAGVVGQRREALRKAPRDVRRAVARSRLRERREADDTVALHDKPVDADGLH